MTGWAWLALACGALLVVVALHLWRIGRARRRRRRWVRYRDTELGPSLFRRWRPQRRLRDDRDRPDLP